MSDRSGAAGGGGLGEQWSGRLGSLEQRAHLSPAALEEAALVGEGDRLVKACTRAEIVTKLVVRRAETGDCVEGPEPRIR